MKLQSYSPTFKQQSVCCDIFPGGLWSEGIETLSLMVANNDPSTFYHLNGNCQYNYPKLNKKITFAVQVIVSGLKWPTG